MRRMLAVILMLGFVGTAMAANTGTTFDKAAVWQDNGDHQSDGREGGENIGTAVMIPSLPYSDTGATCDNVNDYDEVCPYTGSNSQDVVYSYTPGSDESITIDLCNSSYDTKVYVYAGGQGNLVACNDDAGCGYSGYQSRLENVSLSGGVTYYIVVDGYGGSCGSYSLTIEGFEPCVVECPGGALMEGEPTCQDNYYDNYNGGCNSTGWTLIEGQGDGCATLCGKSCTYLYQGSSYRDTDWFQLYGAGGVVNASVEAEFPVQFIFIYGTDCNNLVYDITTAGACQTASLSRNVGAGVEFWLWVGAQVFSGVPESDYVLNVCGIQDGVVPTQEASWGTIKNQYK